MLSKRGRIGLFWGFSLGLAVGCQNVPKHTYSDCLRPVEEVKVLAPARARVNVFMMNGADPLELGGNSELKDEIIRAGFPKVYYAQRPDREWYHKEIFRLYREDPDNRFVLIAYGTAADQVRELAVQLVKDKIPLDMVIFIDPAGENADLTACPFPSLMIRSHHWLLSRRLQPTETMIAHGTRHPNVPNAPATVQQVLEVLTASARRVPYALPVVQCVPVLDPKKPIPRPDEPKEIPPLPPEWRFLCPSGVESVPGR